MPKPTIAITMGDAAGIGPELIVKVLTDESVFERCNPLVVGDAGVMAENAHRLGSSLRFRPIAHLAEAHFAPPEIDVLCPPGVHIEKIPWGQIDATMGKAAALCLQLAFELAMAGSVQGVVAAPLNKQAFHLAGYNYYDDLAWLADLTHSTDTFILGETGVFWTVSVTEHVPFADIVRYIKKDRILRRTRYLYNALCRVGYDSPRIAVAALNVHAGEGGLFGREEIDEITPAIEAARQDGMNVVGPIPADTVFVRAREGEFDGVVAMYHDQANIARKLQATRKGASFYMGLPVVCGTTAHGTAFDKAGKGVAEPASLSTALHYVILLSQ